MPTDAPSLPTGMPNALHASPTHPYSWLPVRGECNPLHTASVHVQKTSLTVLD